MLSRSAALVLLVAATVGVLPPGMAHADGTSPEAPPVTTVTGDTRNGVVSTTVISPGGPVVNPVGGGESSSSGGGVRCSWKAESAYSQQVFTWLGADPNGTWYDVTCSDGSFYPGVYVPPSAGNLPPAVALTGSLAMSAANRLLLPRPAVRRNPTGYALVNLPTWFWLDGAQWRPLRQRTQAGPVWAEVTATPVSSSWDPGDGAAPVACNGPGTPYDTTRSAQSQSTDCSYTYRHSSADQPQTGPSANDRFFTVTVTTTWQVTWVGYGGSSGTLPALTTSSSFPLAVAQRETVVTGGSG